MEEQKKLMDAERKKRDELLYKLDAKSHERIRNIEIDKSSEIDLLFVRDFVVPYLSDVYYSLINIEGKGYLRT
jgi:hypothetical protein